MKKIQPLGKFQNFPGIVFVWEIPIPHEITEFVQSSTSKNSMEMQKQSKTH